MNPLAQWWPVALSHELRNKPLACQVHDTPLVLFRAADGRPAALPYRCPHRFAPLSAGKVRDGQIECPYHGWRFAADGRCTRVPGTDLAPCSKPLLDSLPSCEAHGLVWVSLSTESPLATPVAPAEHRQKLDTFWITDQVQCSLQDAAENFLDGFHTHFVHAGWIRHDKQRPATGQHQSAALPSDASQPAGRPTYSDRVFDGCSNTDSRWSLKHVRSTSGSKRKAS